MTVEMISHLLEALMILCFGLSWPLSIYKSWTSRTARELGRNSYGFEVSRDFYQKANEQMLGEEVAG